MNPYGTFIGTEIAVEVATTEDAAAVASVLEASYPELMAPAYDAAVLQQALPAITRANPKLLGSGTYHVARYHDGLVIGCGGWTAERPGTTQIQPGIGHIRHFAVHPRWIGRGIGRRIYQACETQARANRITIFEVFASLNALPFYESMGFSKLEEISTAIGSRISFPTVWMRRSI
jgi:GNAT superfamily N-acetyltransferase